MPRNHRRPSAVSRLAALCAALVACLALAACGGSDDSAESSTSAADGAAFPLTETGALGTAEIPERPERVVALSSIDADVALALGVTPVAIPEYTFADDGVAPWQAPLLEEGQTPALVNVDTAVPLEKVAAQRPDVILATGLYSVEEVYDSLAKIAPTVSYRRGAYQDTWQEHALQIGRVLGREEAAERLVADVEERLATEVAEHPEFEGATFSFSNFFDVGQIVTLQGDDDVAVRFLTGLGLVRTPALDDLKATDGGNADVSLEQIGMLDADVVLMLYGSPALRRSMEDNALFANLPAVEGGAYRVVDMDTAIAIRTPSAVTIPYALDKVVPQLASALD